MEKLIVRGIEITFFEAENKAALPISWLVMARESPNQRGMNPKDYEYYIINFVIPDPGWPDDAIFWEETILWQRN